MQQLAHDHDALFIVDEVQTGMGTTGTAWAYQQFGLEPDVVAFSKKVQLGGIMAGRRVDEVTDNVFTVSGRINSTWGGGLVDMVRATRILQIIERDGLFEHARHMGEWLLKQLCDVGARHPDLASHVRGRGLMCAFDLPDERLRDGVVRLLREEHVIVLPCGERSVRLRPALNVTKEELAVGLTAIDRALDRVLDRVLDRPPESHEYR
jgi:L-lysine 6-transaminase